MEGILVIYSIYATYAGWKYLSGRTEFLERPGILYKIIKLYCSFAVGMIYGIFRIVSWFF